MKAKYYQFILLLFVSFFFCNDSSQQNYKNLTTDETLTQLRNKMVDSQIKSRGINDKLVLNAMKNCYSSPFTFQCTVEVYSDQCFTYIEVTSS